MLRNLEDERMRMVWPCLQGVGWVVAPLLPPAALPTVGGVAPMATSPTASSLAHGRAAGESRGRGG